MCLTGTRESEQPIHRYSGFCWFTRRLKNSGSLSRISAAQCLKRGGGEQQSSTVTRCLLIFEAVDLATPGGGTCSMKSGKYAIGLAARPACMPAAGEGGADGPVCAVPCFVCASLCCSPAHLLAAIRFDNPSWCLQLELMQQSILGSFVEVTRAAAARRARGELKPRRSSLGDCGSIRVRSTHGLCDVCRCLLTSHFLGQEKAGNMARMCSSVPFASSCADPSWTVTWQGGKGGLAAQCADCAQCVA